MWDVAEQVVDGVVAAVGESGRVGIRLSPFAWDFNDCREPDVAATVQLNVHLIKELNKRNLAYLHIVTARTEGDHFKMDADLLSSF